MLTTCKHFDIVGNRCSRVTDGKCDDLPECEFKYIEELKAENEILKSQLDFEVQKKEVLEAENERLKKVAFQSQNAAIHINQQADKYLGCLQEIKAIAEKECKDCLSKRNDSCWICPYYPILDLITKAESEEV